MAGLVWSVPPTQAFGELADAYETAIRRGIWMIANKWAPQIEAWMKANAPWFPGDGWDGGRVVPLPPGYTTTGNARQALYTEVHNATASMVEIILAHGVEYGLWLEVRHQGRWAIITPALDYFAVRIWRDVARMMS